MKLHFCWTHPGLENTYTQLLFKEGIQYYKKEFNCFKWVKLFYLRLSANWRDDVPQDTSWLNKKGIFILKKRLQWGKIQIKCCKTPGMFCGNFTQLSINMTVSRWWLNTLNVFAASLSSHCDRFLAQIRLSDTVSLLHHVCRPNQVRTSSGCLIASFDTFDTCQEEKTRSRPAVLSVKEQILKSCCWFLKLWTVLVQNTFDYCRPALLKTFYFSFLIRFVDVIR